MAPTSNDPSDPEAYDQLHLGYMFREHGKHGQTEQAFVRSRDGWLVLERKALAMEAIAGLAGTKWKQGEGTQALSLVEDVMDYLAHHPLEGVDEPIWIYPTCYHVFQGCDDGCAADILQQAHDRLMANAVKIIDPAIRTRFLGHVPAHHELMQLWEGREG